MNSDGISGSQSNQRKSMKTNTSPDHQQQIRNTIKTHGDQHKSKNTYTNQCTSVLINEMPTNIHIQNPNKKHPETKSQVKSQKVKLYIQGIGMWRSRKMRIESSVFCFEPQSGFKATFCILVFGGLSALRAHGGAISSLIFKFDFPAWSGANPWTSRSCLYFSTIPISKLSSTRFLFPGACVCPC